MINLMNLSKDYGNGMIVKDITLTINDGEIFGLLGPNGAGKSTTLKMMTGILYPTKGDVSYDGESITQNAIQAKSSFGYVSDSPDMFLGFTGLDYLTFIASVYHMSQTDARKRIEELSLEFHMEKDLNETIINYSHGMRQKIFIISSLMHDPKNWILDEPMTGLDPDSAFKVKQRMRKQKEENKTVLFSTHVLDVAEKICDRIGILQKGELRFVGTMDELREKENLTQGDLEDLFLNFTK